MTRQLPRRGGRYTGLMDQYLPRVQAMRADGLKMEAIAAELGVSTCSVSVWLRGGRAAVQRRLAIRDARREGGL